MLSVPYSQLLCFPAKWCADGRCLVLFVPRGASAAERVAAASWVAIDVHLLWL